MMNMIVSLPSWQIIRTLGIASFVLLTVGICLGIAHGFPQLTGKAKKRVYKLHTLLTNGGTVLGLLHGAILVIDAYMPFAWSEVLIPFTAKQHPILNGLGTLAAYAMLLLIFTSDIRHKLGRKIWLAIHLLSYPIFAAALIHGFFIGTDTQQLPVRMMYLASFAAVAIMTGARAAVRRYPDRPQTRSAA
ncbi:ferric reductase-like transmembrane domain-containing protein [Gordoniibacillus kamchatkensis]|uniref:ferric reductase-like transmembrane domain-containing protein n=1 Tax=Gordoniibacillus kamchatkensis TaxID=1590651 RepID=UPI000695E071|nr:ferric reductase-like transmembrane domain-containing protein [Paenibacillus sp. VKM B-2647]